MTAWELYMLLDDRPAYPMTSVIDVRLSGRLDEGVFRAAVDDVLKRHPLLACRIQRHRMQTPCWIPAPELKPRLDWASAGTPRVCADGIAIDLRRELGWRIWVRQDEQEAIITIQLHHSLCDGVAILEVIGDLLAAYGMRVADEEHKPRLAPIDMEKLRLRNQFNRTPAASDTPWADFWNQRWHSLNWLLFAPKPVLPPAERPAPPATPPELPGNVVHVLSKAEWKAFRRAADRHEVSPNELLLRDLYLTLDRWNCQQKPDWRGRLRITIPVSLRELEHEGMPAANLVTHAFLTRNQREYRNTDGLLGSVHWRIERIMRQKRGLLFLNGIELIRWAPLLKPLLDGGRCFSSSVLTNLGNPVRRFTAQFPYESGRAVVGNLRLLSIVGAPPVRPKTRAVFGLTACRSELMIAARCDPYLFSPAESARLAAMFGDQIRKSSGDSAGGASTS